MQSQINFNNLFATSSSFLLLNKAGLLITLYQVNTFYDTVPCDSYSACIISWDHLYNGCSQVSLVLCMDKSINVSTHSGMVATLNKSNIFCKIILYHTPSLRIFTWLYYFALITRNLVFTWSVYGTKILHDCILYIFRLDEVDMEKKKMMWNRLNLTFAPCYCLTQHVMRPCHKCMRKQVKWKVPVLYDRMAILKYSCVWLSRFCSLSVRLS